MRQVVIVLTDTNAHIPDEFHVGDTWHRYRVIMMCEQDPASLLAHEGLAPLAVLARTDNPEALLREVADRVHNIPQPDLRGDMTAAASILAGLRFDKALVKRLFKEEIMIQSSIYQDIEQRGIRRALQEQLLYRFGQLSETVQKALSGMELQSLLQLSKALLDFKTKDDLDAWLERNKQASAHAQSESSAIPISENGTV